MRLKSILNLLSGLISKWMSILEVLFSVGLIKLNFVVVAVVAKTYVEINSSNF